VKARHLDKARAEWAQGLAAFRGQGKGAPVATIPIRAV